MKKILYWIFFGFITLLLAGCDDDKETPVFDLSTDEWSFAKEGGTQNLIISAPGGWEVSEKPDWCTLIPESAEGPREVKIDCSANTEKKREGTLVLTCGAETRMIAISQQGAYVVKGFPVEWLFTADYYASGKYTDAFVVNNSLPAQIGEGTISYIQDDANTRPITKVIGATGHPYLSGSLTGDYWLFQILVKELLPAGTVMHIKFITRSAAGAARYWSLEYFDNESWKPIATQRTAEVAGEKVVYTLDLVEDLTGNKKVGTDNAQIDNDFTLSAQIAAGGLLQCRLRCVADIACNGVNPNTGNHRLAGAVGTSPVISVVSID